jgi:hypothetical protein
MEPSKSSSNFKQKKLLTGHGNMWSGLRADYKKYWTILKFADNRLFSASWDG